MSLNYGLGILLSGALLGAAACQQEESPLMRPGDNCLDCHNGHQVELKWNAAGTVFRSPTAATDQGLEGAKVTLTDAKGRSVTLTTNQAGNFYTAEPLTAPFAVRLEHNGNVREMSQPREGTCNGCHKNPPDSGGPPGRLFIE